MSINKFENNFLIRMTDGTLKQVNPFSGAEVWTVVGRGNRPIAVNNEVKELDSHDPEDYCIFCPTQYFKTPPEKSRLIATNGEYKMLHNLAPSKINDTVAEFRRVSNLFEIISYDYWVENYDYVPHPIIMDKMSQYLSDPQGKEHIINTINFKLKSSGQSDDDIASISDEDKIRMATGFFAGCHELIIGKRHYIKDAEFDNQNASSGEMTTEEHNQYIKFTIHALKDIFITNRYARFVTVFQNWMKPAGASLDHLHKQLVAIDGRGEILEQEIARARNNPNAFNEYAVNFASYHNLIIAENDYAVAFADFGHRFPTLAIYSKSKRNQPWNHSDEEVRGMSDLVHACHAAMGSELPCNEEWYYRPPDVDVAMPWHILIKWRISNPAGFEAVTNIYVNTIDPWMLRDKVVTKLYELRNQGKIEKSINISTECDCVPNCLLYNPNITGTHQLKRSDLERLRGETLNF